MPEDDDSDVVPLVMMGAPLPARQYAQGDVVRPCEGSPPFIVLSAQDVAALMTINGFDTPRMTLYELAPFTGGAH